ncbi:MAG: hypothetical protein N2Z22_09040 [Turneriella sp.]|nr:hypothetical protein [Turneriella sp.]
MLGSYESAVCIYKMTGVYVLPQTTICEGNMKKLTATALLVAAISFWACSSSEEKKSETPAEAPKAEAAPAAPAAPAKAPAAEPAKAPAKAAPKKK